MRRKGLGERATDAAAGAGDKRSTASEGKQIGKSHDRGKNVTWARLVSRREPRYRPASTVNCRTRISVGASLPPASQVAQFSKQFLVPDAANPSGRGVSGPARKRGVAV